MRVGLWAAAMVILWAGVRTGFAQRSAPLSLGPDVESVYAPPEPQREDTGVNEGGVNVNFDFMYMTDYIFRGIDRSESGGAEDSPNLQFDGQLKFDLGRWPHPFLGLFSNVYDSDPESRFQEIRPYFGLEINARPILFQLGHNNYIFPERDAYNTGELWAKLIVDDSYFFRTDQPVVQPYFFAAYDYDVNHGLYAEMGISHDFIIEDTPFTLTPQAQIAYVDNNETFILPTAPVTDPGFQHGTHGHASGFQHYQIGLVLTYALNETLHISRRLGEFDLKGYVFYTDGIDNRLRADTEIYGGFGVSFRY